MEYIDLRIASGKIHIPIERKSMKKVRLRVYPNGEIKISAPFGVSYEWIDEYINEKQKWISKKLSDYKQTNGIEAVETISNGTSIKLFGRDYYLTIKESTNKSVIIDENSLVIQVNDIQNQNLLFKYLELWLKKQLGEKLDSYLDSLYPIIKKHGIVRPDFIIRKMKTMWGNCNIPKDKLTFNYYLYQAQPRLIEYVMLHELIHFIHRNHTKEFYALLSLYMPDWEDRKRSLDFEVMQGIKL